MSDPKTTAEQVLLFHKGITEVINDPDFVRDLTTNYLITLRALELQNMI